MSSATSDPTASQRGEQPGSKPPDSAREATSQLRELIAQMKGASPFQSAGLAEQVLQTVTRLPPRNVAREPRPSSRSQAEGAMAHEAAIQHGVDWPEVADWGSYEKGLQGVAIIKQYSGAEAYLRSGYRSEDRRILQDVLGAIVTNANVHARRLRVVVDRGEVVLQGLVDTRSAKEIAESLVKDIPGVRDLRSSIEVESDYRAGDEGIGSPDAPFEYGEP